MGWLEFTVIVVCGLLGFIVVNAAIDSRRALAESRQETDEAEEYEDEWWEILKVDPDAPPEEIKSAFRRAISQYHPDRVEGLGIELRELADRKAKEVNRAYTLAKEERGFR
jgi:DnaJ-domain-containing protein 1